MNITTDKLTEIELDTRIETLLSNADYGPMSEAMHKFLSLQIFSQGVERTIVELLPNMDDDVFLEFSNALTTIEENNPHDKYALLVSLFPNQQNVIFNNIYQCLQEFKNETT